MAAPRQMAQEFVVKAGRVQGVGQVAVDVRVVIEHLHVMRVLVAEQELDFPVLVRLEPRG